MYFNDPGEKCDCMKQQEPAIVIERTKEFEVVARKVGDFIKALPLTQPDNDRLIDLIIEQVQVAERGAFYHGAEIGMRYVMEQPV